MGLKIAPSLASAPLDRLGQVIHELEQSGADSIHFDIEDGVFTPVMTLGTKIIADLRPLTRLPFDIHLMMVNPEWLIPSLARMGANRISVHYETCPYPRRILRAITTHGVQAGLALNPATPLPDLAFLRPYLSFVVVLTTEPEIPDSPFLPSILNKVTSGKMNPALDGIEWIADGGIDANNLSQVIQVGAGSIVAGRAVFKDGTITKNLQALRQATAQP
jgi:ribulose-phosphate 3-epimerase